MYCVGRLERLADRRGKGWGELGTGDGGGLVAVGHVTYARVFTLLH